MVECVSTKTHRQPRGISSMESIQQIAEKFIKAIVAIDICEGLTEGLEKMKQLADKTICRMAEHKLEEIDEALYVKSNLRRGWCVEHKNVPRELLSKHGLLKFERRYYLNPKTGERRYLVDNLVGIERYERLEAGLAANLCEKATDHSYAKSSRLCCEGDVSRQTVMRKTRQVKGCQLSEVECRDEVRVIHIQADEDHVAMQDGRRDTIVKLVAIHEPVLKVSHKRWKLPQRHLMSSYNEATDDFWLRVADEVDRRYGDRDDLTIYIHGDGASWIRSGTQWLKNSHFVLDKFHVRQKLNRVVGDNEDYKQYIWDQLALGERLNIIHLTEACMNSDVCAEKSGIEFMQYIRSNWDGIQIWYDENHQAGGSCAEGLVSHVLSSRLSSRPCGWRDEGLETVSRLRVHLLNGGQITPENLRKPSKPAIRTTKALKKVLTTDYYNDSRALSTDHRSSPDYRLFKTITSGGRAI
jgi:hypothetical protein